MIKRLSEVLTIVFVTLKLTGVVNWPWYIVLLPLIIHFGIVIGLFLILVTFLAIKK